MEFMSVMQHDLCKLFNDLINIFISKSVSSDSIIGTKMSINSF
jgi:hypothetical protein